MQTKTTSIFNRFVTKIFLVSAFILAGLTVFSQTIELLKDIRTIENPDFSSSPASLIKAGDRFFFTAYTEETKTELWVSDGTSQGTYLVKDLTPGAHSNSIDFKIFHKGLVYFSFVDINRGYELWRSDGTDVGTFLVKDINPGIGSSIVQDFVVFQDKVFFSAWDGAHHRDLWYTDGTLSGTQKITLPALLRERGPHNICASGADFYFLTTDSLTRKKAIWKLDAITLDISPIPLPINQTNELYNPSSLKLVEDMLIITTENGLNDPIILWRMTLKTGELKQIELPQGEESKVVAIYPNSIIKLGDLTLFMGRNNTTGKRFWSLHKDSIIPTLITVFPETHKAPDNFTAFHNKIFFIGFDDRLWSSDGTKEGTKKVISNFSDSILLHFTTFEVLNNKIVFPANLNNNIRSLWTFEVDDADKTIIKKYCETPSFSDPYYLVSFDSVIYFNGYDNVHGQELWRGDGTCEGTKLLKNINSKPGGSYPTNLVVSNGKLFFNAWDDSTGNELWVSDGVENSPHLLFNFTNDRNKKTAPRLTTKQTNGVVFATSYNDNDEESADLWASDGTIEGTKKISDFGISYHNFRRFIHTDKHTYMECRTSQGTHELWATDGTKDGTNKFFESPIVFSYNFTTTHKSTLFSYDGDLWTTDGTESGTKSLNLKNSTCVLHLNTELETSNNITYFNASGVKSNTGNELWCRDGNTGERRLVKDFTPGMFGSFISNFTAYKSKMLFQVHKFNSNELWITNGTDKGTYKVKDLDLFFSPEFIQLGDFMYFTDNIFFTIDNLWRTDGTAEGTTIVLDYFWMIGGSKIRSMVRVNDFIYFTLNLDDSGEELWRTDGTEDGTAIVEDLMPGATSSSPEELTAGKNILYFTADHPEYGRELFYIKVPRSKTDNEEISKIKYRVYPNPANGETSVEYEYHKPGEEHTLKLFDVLGRKVYHNSSTLNPMPIELYHLTPGTYFIRSENQSTKVVVY